MSNLFKMHMEDRTSDMPEGVLITEGDEGESVAATIQELTTESAEVEGAEEEMEEVADDAETLEEVEEAIAEAPKTEAYGLNESNARLLTVLLRSVGGSAYPKSFMPKMENFGDRHNRGHATQLTMEGIAETLKSFWEALKAAFNKTMAKIKSWGIKTFSSARKLKEKATKIRDKANSTASTVDNKTFKFSQAKLIHMDGKVKEPSTIRGGLDKLKKIVTSANEVHTTSAIDAMETAIENAADVKASNGVAATTEIAAVSDQLKKFLLSETLFTGDQNSIDSKIQKSLSVGVDNGGKTATTTGELPGGKQLIRVVSGKDPKDLDAIGGSGVWFMNMKDKPKEVGSDMDVKTLNNSEIASFADLIIESVEDIIEVENKWEKVDKARDRIIKALDRKYKDKIADLDHDEEPKNGADPANIQERDFRKKARVFTNVVSTASKTAPTINSYAIGVYGAVLNWCEGSARNHKA